MDDLQAHYSRLSDFDIAELHAQGRDAFVSDVVWNAVCGEFQRRAPLAGSTTAEVIDERRAAEATAAAVTRSHPPLGARAFQGIIDSLAAAAVAVTLGLMVGFATQSESLAFLAMLIGFFGYQIFFEARGQATPVMQVMGLKVVTTLGNRPSTGRLIARALLRPLGLVGLLWYALAGTWWGHDVLTGTRIVQVSGDPDPPITPHSAV